jgi:hypothetical protein
MKQSNFELAKKVIGQAIFDLLPSEDSQNNESREAVNSLINATEEGYILVQWPESQELMEEEWFDDEAILALGSEDKTGSGAYFVPIKRVI